MSLFSEGAPLFLNRHGLTASENDWFSTPLAAKGERWKLGNVMLEIERDLDAEREKQLNALIALGFHNMVGLSEESYRESFPKFPPKPEGRYAEFNVPLLVDPRPPITPDDTLTNYDEEKLSQYAIWTDRATRIELYTENRYKLGSEEKRMERSDRGAAMALGVPCTYFELVAMAIHHPELFSIARTIGAPGSTLNGREIMFTRNDKTRQLDLSIGNVGINGLTRHDVISGR